MQRKILYDKGQREYGDYDAFVFDEEYLKELIKMWVMVMIRLEPVPQSW